MRFLNRRALKLIMLCLITALLLLPAVPTAAQVKQGVWLAEYYAGRELKGDVLLTQTLPGPFLFITWPPDSSPGSNVPAGEWSARFRTLATFPGGNVKFILRADDGARLYINGALIIDAWEGPRDGYNTWEARVLYVPAGTYLLQVDYYDLAGFHIVDVSFPSTTDLPAEPDKNFVIPGRPAGDGQGGGGQPTGAPPPAAPSGGTGVGATPPPGGILLDESDPRYFVWAGVQVWGFRTGGYYNNAFAFTDNSEFFFRMWGRWNVNIPRAGAWDVYAYIPNQANATTNARYRVFAAGSLSGEIRVDQSANRGQWVWLGTHTFKAGGTQYLYLNDLTFEPDGSRLVLYDSVKFVEHNN